MFRLGHVQIPSRLILAPMSGITSLPFRALNRMFGCECAFAEMLDISSLSFSSRRSQEMIRTDAQDRPLGLQLLGNNAEQMIRAIEKTKDVQFDILDFNAACPRRKVTRQGEGASLLREPEKLQRLLITLVKHAPVPVVTAKIRLGWSMAQSAVDLALRVEDSGVHALFVHGRTREQAYSGSVNYAAIRVIKQSLRIPVIASGDILSPLLAKKMFDETGCDAVLVARGALGNPWIFRETIEFFKHGSIPQRPSTKELIETIKSHLDLTVDFYGEAVSIMRFRKFFIWYTKGFSGVKDLRSFVSRVKRREEMITLIHEFEHRIS